MSDSSADELERPRALEEWDERLDALIASAMDAIVSLDEQQRVVLTTSRT